MTTPKAVIRRYTDAGYNENNPAVIEETVTDDVVVHGLPGIEDTVRGVDAYLDWAGDVIRAIPDADVEIESLLSEDDMVAVHWTMSGTMEDDLGDIPATGETFDVRALAIFRIEDGQIAEKWYNVDEVGMMEQLGLRD